MIGFYKLNGRNASCTPFRRTHVTSATIMNAALLAEHDIYFDQRIFVWEDLDFNLRLSAAGLVIAKSYRQMLFKVNMPTGGCAGYASRCTPVPEPEVPVKLMPVPDPEPKCEPRPLCELRVDEVRESALQQCTFRHMRTLVRGPPPPPPTSPRNHSGCGSIAPASPLSFSAEHPLQAAR